MYSCYRFVKFYHKKPIQFDGEFVFEWSRLVCGCGFHSHLPFKRHERNECRSGKYSKWGKFVANAFDGKNMMRSEERCKRLGAANFDAILYFLRMPFSIAKLAGFEAIDRSISNRRCTLDIIVSQFQHFVIFAVTAMDPANDTQGYYCIYLFTFCTLPDAHFCTSFLHTCYDPT